MAARGPSRSGVFIRQVAAAPWTMTIRHSSCAERQSANERALRDRGGDVALASCQDGSVGAAAEHFAFAAASRRAASGLSSSARHDTRQELLMHLIL